VPNFAENLRRVMLKNALRLWTLRIVQK